MNRCERVLSLRIVFLGGLGLAAAILTACGTVGELKTAKESAAKGEYGKLAATPVSCKPADDGCNQLHLIRGDACYRLAKQGDDKPGHYRCAADELELGIQQTKDWKDIEALGKPAVYYENYCESLRMVRDQQNSNDASAPWNQKLSTCAKDFLSLAPNHPAGLFFLNNAKLAQFQIEFKSKKQNPTAACAELNAMLAGEKQASALSANTPYAENHERLTRDIAGMKRSPALPGCQ